MYQAGFITKKQIANTLFSRSRTHWWFWSWPCATSSLDFRSKYLAHILLELWKVFREIAAEYDSKCSLIINQCDWYLLSVISSVYIWIENIKKGWNGTERNHAAQTWIIMFLNEKPTVHAAFRMRDCVCVIDARCWSVVFTAVETFSFTFFKFSI